MMSRTSATALLKAALELQKEDGARLAKIRALLLANPDVLRQVPELAELVRAA